VNAIVFRGRRHRHLLCGHHRRRLPWTCRGAAVGITLVLRSPTSSSAQTASPPWPPRRIAPPALSPSAAGRAPLPCPHPTPTAPLYTSICGPLHCRRRMAAAAVLIPPPPPQASAAGADGIKRRPPR
jgi:hypothetical protein